MQRTPPAPPPKGTFPGTRGSYGPKERTRRLALLEHMVKTGTSRAQIEQVMLSTFGVGRKGVTKLMGIFWDQLAKQNVEAAPHLRAMQLARIERRINKLENLRHRTVDKKGVATESEHTGVNEVTRISNAIAEQEKLWMKIAGTEAPKVLRVDHNVQGRLAAVVSNMTDEMLDRIVDEYDERAGIAAGRKRQVVTAGRPAAALPAAGGKRA
jgi:hypothetical protein